MFILVICLDLSVYILHKSLKLQQRTLVKWVLQVRKDRHGSKSGQIVFHACYQGLYCIANQGSLLGHILYTYYIDPKTGQIKQIEVIYV